jgi:zinc finger protein DZIP1
MSFLPAANAQNQAPSFTFRKRHARIDWRKLAAVDVDKVAREVDVGSLQDNLYNVAFCNIDGEEFQGMDPHFMKLFKLAQLTMEYLMYTQQYLNSQVTELQQKLKDVSEEMECCKKELATRNDDLKAVKKENRKRRKAIEAYQEMLSSGATGIHPCPVCKREFITGDFLQSHIDRRHPEHPSSKSRISEDYQARLLQQVTEKVRESERMFKEELSLRERRTKDEKEREFEEWKRMEKRHHEEEMDRARRPLLEQIEKLHQEKQQVEASVVEQKDLLATARLQLSSAREETAQVQEQAKVLSDRELSRKTQIDAEIESLKSSFAEQVGNLKQEQKKRSKSWKKDMEEMRSAYERQLHESQVKMHSLEQTLQSSWREGQREAELAMTNQVGDLQQV